MTVPLFLEYSSGKENVYDEFLAREAELELYNTLDNWTRNNYYNKLIKTKGKAKGKIKKRLSLEYLQKGDPMERFKLVKKAYLKKLEMHCSSEDIAVFKTAPNLKDWIKNDPCAGTPTGKWVIRKLRTVGLK